MKTPDFVKGGSAIQLNSEGQNLYKDYFEGDLTVDSENGGACDAFLIDGVGTGEWIDWKYLEPVDSVEAPKAKPPTKTERKRLAKLVEQAYNDLIEALQSAEQVGLVTEVFVDSVNFGADDMVENQCVVSFQPDTPPVEKLVSINT